jgi:hypothetical protein
MDCIGRVCIITAEGGSLPKPYLHNWCAWVRLVAWKVAIDHIRATSCCGEMQQSATGSEGSSVETQGTYKLVDSPIPQAKNILDAETATVTHQHF